MPADTRQGKHWIVTYQTTEQANECFDEMELSYWSNKDIIYSKGQLEKGQTGNWHWQFVVCFQRKVRLFRLQQVFPGGHFELTRSEAAHEYVWKDDTSQG